MKKLISFILISCLVLPFGISANKLNNGDIYFQGTYHQAIKTAQTHGKLMVLQFSADWCIPCQWMKKTTFKDSKLVDYLSKNAITLDVNIDNFDGFELKEQYEVKYLPTIILLNTEGDELIKIEESIGAEKLLRIIKTYSTNDNTTKIGVNYSNSEINSDLPLIEPVKSESASPIAIIENKKEEKPEKQIYVKEEEISNEISDYEDSLIDYNLQIGAFNTLQNAQQLEHLTGHLLGSHPTIIQFESGKYKVICTEFNSKASIKDLQIILMEELQIQSFMRLRIK